MRVFKHKRKVRGVVQESKSWYFEFKDANHVLRRIKLFPDKTVSESAARKILSLVSHIQCGELPNKSMLQWLDKSPDWIRNSLAKWGLVRRHYAAKEITLKKHIDDWAAYLAREGDSREYVKQAPVRVRRLVKECDWNYISDLSGSNIQDWITEQRENDTMAAWTINTYIQSAKAFVGWLLNVSERITNNPFEGVKLLSTSKDRRRVRRAATEEALADLILATEDGPLVTKICGLSGRERGLLYRVAYYTGYRWSELWHLRRSSFRLKELIPHVFLEAKFTKNGSDAFQPIPKDFANELLEYMELFPSDAPAFPMWKGKGARMLRCDLCRAGVPYVNELGEYLDFHAIRHTTASHMNKTGVPLGTAQKVMRHSDPKVTAEYYIHTELAEKAAALKFLPSLKAGAPPNLCGQSSEVTSDEVLDESSNSETEVTEKRTVSSDVQRPGLSFADLMNRHPDWVYAARKNPENACETSTFGAGYIGAGEEIRTLDPHLGKVVL